MTDDDDDSYIGFRLHYMAVPGPAANGGLLDYWSFDYVDGMVAAGLVVIQMRRRGCLCIVCAVKGLIVQELIVRQNQRFQVG